MGLVSQPEGGKVIVSYRLYRIKLNIDGVAHKFKARLVARGFAQKVGVNFNQTCSHNTVVKSSRSIRRHLYSV